MVIGIYTIVVVQKSDQDVPWLRHKDFYNSGVTLSVNLCLKAMSDKF
jgi:hypothetical protein